MVVGPQLTKLNVDGGVECDGGDIQVVSWLKGQAIYASLHRSLAIRCIRVLGFYLI